MKKLSIFAVAFAAMMFAACGGNKTAQNVEQEDSVKSFEQEQIEASIKMHFDSLASELGKLKQLPVVAKDGQISLTEEEKQVKPDYLLDLAVADNAMTLSEKYRVLSAIEVDKEVAKLYEMPVDDYDKVIGKLAAEINDPSFKAIDDVNGVTLVSASTLDKDFDGFGGNAEAAKKVGLKIAERAKEKGITEVVFDRGGYIFHGRVAALAEGAREGGLEF